MPEHKPKQDSEQDHEPSVRVHVLGALRVSGTNGNSIPVPRQAHHLIAILTAAGPDGISRVSVTDELWRNGRPDSWMSALRNRTTAVRKTLGQHAIVNQGDRYQLAPNVRVDSWEIVAHQIEQNNSANELWFLDGEPLADMADSPLRLSHVREVHQARVTLTATVLNSRRPVSATALQSLRVYLQAHPSDVSIASSTIRAHVQADQFDRAASILAEIRLAASQSVDLHDSIPRLEHLLRAHPDELGAINTARLRVNDRRASLFQEAARLADWSLALEIALEGLPAAERIDGDPTRLALLEDIPTSELERSRKFAHALALARHLMYAGRELEAQQWSAVARENARSPNEELLSYITSAIVGETGDERLPMKLPDTFPTAPTKSISSRSLHVAVMSHLERDSCENSLALFERFQTSVVEDGDPHRRWHLLLLQSMYAFVDGRLQDAADAAHAAHEFAELFGIVDGEIALIGQLSNARLLDPRLCGIDDYVSLYPTSANGTLSKALQAVHQARLHGGSAVDEFLSTFDYQSRTFFTFPVVALTAPYVVDPELRSTLVDRLRDRTGTSAIFGSGVIHLGPVDRTLAGLVDSETEALSLFASAVDIADYQRTRVWQIICRLDLAAATGNTQLRNAAAELATTPELRDLLTMYQPLQPAMSA